ncbi:MAG: LytTR family DNA-binding domain-containing protein [bacterium]
MPRTDRAARPPIRAIVVDDEPLARDALRHALRHESDVVIVAECRNGPEAVSAIKREAPDLVFLDIQLTEMDGFGVIDAVGTASMPEVVFVTAFDRFAVRAFEVHALDYLLKPFTDERFHAALGQARRRLRADAPAVRELALTALLRQVAERETAATPVTRYATRLTVRRNDSVRFIPVGEIDSLEAEDGVVTLCTGREQFTIRRPLKDILTELDPSRFVQIHRGTVVNIARVREVQPWFNGDYVAIMVDGRQLRVSRHFRDDVIRPSF